MMLLTGDERKRSITEYIQSFNAFDERTIRTDKHIECRTYFAFVPCVMRPKSLDLCLFSKLAKSTYVIHRQECDRVSVNT